MRIIFTAWLLIGNQFEHGSQHEGWWPMPTGSEEECARILTYAMARAPADVVFTCETLEDTLEYVQK
jgi:hypothetical protein